MTPELKPCPFCGRKPDEIPRFCMGYIGNGVKCKCGCETPKNIAGLEAFMWWNNRAKAQAVPQWIPVSERLPPVGELGSSNEYIVYETLNNKVQHDYFIITDDGHPPFWNYYDNHVTHWMPLPPAPEQNK